MMGSTMRITESVTEKAYAKINLYLDVVGRREDGYHNIESVMQTVSLYDTVRVSLTEEEGISMTCTDGGLLCDEKNLCIKAARAFVAASGVKSGIFIELEKRIPMQAGLGGGSADAAAVLRALNSLFDDFFTAEELRNIAKRIGADVPFCIVGGTCLAEGIGEILTPLRSVEGLHIVITMGEGASSTPEAYKAIDSKPAAKKASIKAILRAIDALDLPCIISGLYNRFEDVIGGIDEAKSILKKSGAQGVLMSGSGTAVFGVFADKEQAKNASLLLKKARKEAFLCQAVAAYY